MATPGWAAEEGPVSSQGSLKGASCWGSLSQHCIGSGFVSLASLGVAYPSQQPLRMEPASKSMCMMGSGKQGLALG